MTLTSNIQGTIFIQVKVALCTIEALDIIWTKYKTTFNQPLQFLLPCSGVLLWSRSAVCFWRWCVCGLRLKTCGWDAHCPQWSWLLSSPQLALNQRAVTQTEGVTPRIFTSHLGPPIRLSATPIHPPWAQKTTPLRVNYTHTHTLSKPGFVQYTHTHSWCLSTPL